jgi:hypothetical protein
VEKETASSKSPSGVSRAAEPLKPAGLIEAATVPEAPMEIASASRSLTELKNDRRVTTVIPITDVTVLHFILTLADGDPVRNSFHPAVFMDTLMLARTLGSQSNSCSTDAAIFICSHKQSLG